MVVIYNCEQYGTIGAIVKRDDCFIICLPPLIDRGFEEHFIRDVNNCRCKMVKKLKR